MKTKLFKTFPLVVDTEYVEVQGVNPLMQSDCVKLCEMFQDEDDFVLGVFGSSVTERCGMFSDLDLVIRLFGDVSAERFYGYARKISRAGLSVETDIIFYNELDDDGLLKQEIKKNAYPLVYRESIEKYY